MPTFPPKLTVYFVLYLAQYILYNPIVDELLEARGKLWLRLIVEIDCWVEWISPVCWWLSCSHLPD